MKPLAYLVVFLAATTVSFSQANKFLLTNDIIFDKTALKNLRFPKEAFDQGKSVRVYVGFTLTNKGEYHNVSIVNSGSVDESFKQELDRFWSKLPKQDPKYAGHYVMPINFLFGEGGPDKLRPISNETDRIVELRNYKLLPEFSTISYIVCEKRAFVE